MGRKGARGGERLALVQSINQSISPFMTTPLANQESSIFGDESNDALKIAVASILLLAPYRSSFT